MVLSVGGKRVAPALAPLVMELRLVSCLGVSGCLILGVVSCSESAEDPAFLFERDVYAWGVELDPPASP